MTCKFPVDRYNQIFRKTSHCTYHTLFSGTGIHFLNDGNSIETITPMTTLFLLSILFQIYPLIAQQNCKTLESRKTRKLTIRNEIRKTLSVTINYYIVYPEFYNVLEINLSLKSLSIFLVSLMTSARKLFSPTTHFFLI